MSHADAALYINRELSWLEFNARVLHEAFDERNPLLERLKFRSTFGTNRGGFCMVRVAGLRRAVAAVMESSAPVWMTSHVQRAAIKEAVVELIELAGSSVHVQLLPILEEDGV